MYRRPAAPRRQHDQPITRAAALALREGGIVHLRQQPREAGIGQRPRLSPAAARLVNDYLRTQNASASAGNLGHALEHLGHVYKHNPVARNPIVGRKGLLGAVEDLVKTADPVALGETVKGNVQHPLRQPPPGSISAGIVVGGPGGFRVVRSSAERFVTPSPKTIAAKASETRIVQRPATIAEARTRLRVLDRQLEGFYKRVERSTGHPLAEADIAREHGRGSLPLFGKRARGQAVEGRAVGAPVRRSSVSEQLRSAAINKLDQIAKRNPDHPSVKAWKAAEAERAQLTQALHGHLPGETPSGNLGTIAEVQRTPQAEVARSLSAARKARAEQKKLYSTERSARVARGQQAMEEAGGGIAGFKAAMEQQRGELPKVTFERLREGNLKTADVEALVRHAQNHPELKFWEKQNVTKALLDSFEHGRTPTPSEIKLLQTTYGQDAAAALARVSHLKKAGQIAVDVANIPRTVMASVDMSAPFRQGLVAGARHPVIFAQNFKPMVKAFGSERVYQAILDNIHADPNFELATDAGLKFTELGRDLNKREEQFISSKAEKIPLVRASGRAYTGFLDKMRMDVFNRQLELARKQGVNVEDRSELRSIARVVNSATGRGDLGPVEQWAPALNAFFFSPRLIASRVNLLNPIWYASLSPFARKQALISMVRLGSVAAGVLGLGSYAGAKVTTDPRSSDFAKLRIGNTRADVLGGFQQYIRVGSQLASGKVISSTTGKTMTLGPGFGDLSRKDILERFVVGKFSPPPSFVNDFFTGTQFDGSPFSLKKAILARTIPLVLQDAYDLYKNSDSIPLALLGYSISAFGIGMQTYGPQKSKRKNYGGSRSGGSTPFGGSSGSNPLLPSGSSSNPLLP